MGSQTSRSHWDRGHPARTEREARIIGTAHQDERFKKEGY
jgi:hypothetical protein